jgi:hypothetical protein
VSANTQCHLQTLMPHHGATSSRVTNPSHGTAAWDDTGLTYKPDADYRGEDHFQVWATAPESGGQQMSEFEATVTVIVK